jgi:hypothetical protein
MTYGSLKNALKGMLEKELGGCNDSDEVSQEVADNLDVAFAAIIGNATDADEDDEDDDEDEDLEDEEGNDLEGPPPSED